MYFNYHRLTSDWIAKIVITWRNVKINIKNPLLWIGVAIVVLFFLARLGIKKFLSCSIIISFLVFSMFKADKFIIDTFGKEEGDFYTVLTKPIFLFLIAFVFIYYNFIQRE